MAKGLVSPNLLHGPVLWIGQWNPNNPYSGQTFCFLCGQRRKKALYQQVHISFLSAFLTHYSRKESSINVTVCY